MKNICNAVWISIAAIICLAGIFTSNIVDNILLVVAISMVLLNPFDNPWRR